MKNTIKHIWNWIDANVFGIANTFIFNIIAILIFAIGAFIGLITGFSGVWFGWLITAFCIAAVAVYVIDYNKTDKR